MGIYDDIKCTEGKPQVLYLEELRSREAKSWVLVCPESGHQEVCQATAPDLGTSIVLACATHQTHSWGALTPAGFPRCLSDSGEVYLCGSQIFQLISSPMNWRQFIVPKS